MSYQPSDIYRVVEPIIINQGFGDNPDDYKKFGLAGHNGWDYRTKITEDIVLANGKTIKATPNGKRPLLAPWLVNLYRIGHDPVGYGTFFEVIVKLYSTWKLTYGHCTSVHSWTNRSEGSEMAISGSTGNSTADHVHETVKRIRVVNGTHEVLNHDNGYLGAVNPQEFYDELRKWKKEQNIAPEPVLGEDENMQMYRGYDLDNKESMKVAVDSHIRVADGEFITVSESNKKLDDLSFQLVQERERAVKQAFIDGQANGRESVQLPAMNENGEIKIDLSGFEANGLTVETTVGNTKIIKNYKRSA